MIFKQEMVDAILSGRKTVTRRPAKFRQVDEGTRNERSEWLPCRYEAGKTYAVQPGRGKKGVARIRVLSVTRSYMHELDDAEVRAEGFDSTAAFQRTWLDIYGRGSFLDAVYRIEFELLPTDPTEAHPSDTTATKNSPVPQKQFPNPRDEES